MGGAAGSIGDKQGRDGYVSTSPPGQGNVTSATAGITADDAGTGIKAEQLFGDQAANKEIFYNNPNINTAFGGQTLTRDDQGRLQLDQTLSDPQQQILDQQQGISNQALGFAGNRLDSFGSDFDPTLSQRSMSGDLLDDRRRIEDDVFKRLTRNLERDRGADLNSAEAQIAAKGIPFSADPKSRYQTELRNVQERYDERADNARARATEMGGDEFLRQFGAQEQLRANELSEQGGIRGTNLSELGSLQGFGSGLILPNLPGYQAPTPWRANNPYDIFANNQNIQQGWQGLDNQAAGLDIQRGQLALNQQQANRPPAGPPQPTGPTVKAGP